MIQHVNLSVPFQTAFLATLATLWHCCWVYTIYLQDWFMSPWIYVHPAVMFLFMVCPYMLLYFLCSFAFCERKYRKKHPFLYYGAVVSALTPVPLLFAFDVPAWWTFL
jgi:hypothetical protein